MKNKNYVLISDWGRFLGTGHIQRMTALLDYLTFIKKEHAVIVCNNLPDLFPEKLKPNWQTGLPEKCDLIIRDMRDSAPSEIKKLKEIAPVIVVDDKGEGRNSADLAIDLLPDENKKSGELFLNMPFLYGYNFYSQFINENDFLPKESYDFIIYCGYGADKDYIGFLISLFPKDANLLLMNGKEVLKINDDNYEKTGLSPAQAFLFSKGILSHFGLSLYEAFLCGCKSVVINPSRYHADLTEKVKDELDLVNGGIYPDVDIAFIKEQILRIINMKKKPVNQEEIRDKILKGLELFYNKIISV